MQPKKRPRGNEEIENVSEEDRLNDRQPNRTSGVVKVEVRNSIDRRKGNCSFVDGCDGWYTRMNNANEPFLLRGEMERGVSMNTSTMFSRSWCGRTTKPFEMRYQAEGTGFGRSVLEHTNKL